MFSFAAPYVITVVGGKGAGKTAACLKLAHWIQNRPCSERCSTWCATRACSSSANHTTNHSFSVGLVQPESCAPVVVQQAHEEQLDVPILTAHSCLPSDFGATWPMSALSGAKFVAASHEEARRLNLSVLIFDCPALSQTSGERADPGMCVSGKTLLASLLPHTDLLLFAVDAQQGLYSPCSSPPNCVPAV